MLNAYDESKKIMLITYARNGFFSNFIASLNSIRWCEKKSITPVVCWGKKCLYYDKDGYNGSMDPWEYYFEPVSNVSIEEAKKRTDAVIHHKYADPSGKSIPNSSCQRRGYKNLLVQDYRKNINKTIKKYVKIKPSILEKVDRFYKDFMSDRATIGLHIRGTDKGKHVTPVSPETICLQANQFAESHPGCQFFVATDEVRLLEEVKKYLKGPVIFYDSYRSVNGRPVHLFPQTNNKAILGEEVLIEALLLSRCNKFVHTRSNVSSAVLLFNPTLENLLVYEKNTCRLR